MKPNEYSVGRYLENAVQLHVPRYQRPYEWDIERWTDLWRDIAHQYRQVSKKRSNPPHFIGALIVEGHTSPEGTGVEALSVIDGQQRLLTIFAIMAAVRDHEAFAQNVLVSDDNDLTTIHQKYSKRTYRLKVRPQNEEAMAAILEGKCCVSIPEAVYESPLAQAYRFFRYQLWLGTSSVQLSKVAEPPRPKRSKGAPPRGSYEPWGSPAVGKRSLDLGHLHSVLTQGLRLLELRLDDTDEESSVIFETMNSKSTPLRQFDLLRNSIFVRMPKGRDKFYTSTWQKIEELLTSVSYASLRNKPEDQFFYEYVIATGQEKVASDKVHHRWLTGVIDEIGYDVTVKSEQRFAEDFAAPLVKAAGLYPIAVGQRRQHTLLGEVWSVTADQHQVIKEILATSGGPPVPVVLKALIDHHDGHVSSDELDEMLRMVQSFLLRLILVGQDLSPLRSVFMTVAAALPDPLTPSDLHDSLTNAGWSTDKEVLDVITSTSLEQFTSASLFPLLRGIERQLSGAGAHTLPFGSQANQYSLEHVFPQTSNIGSGWEAELKKWKVARDNMEARRYTLGNFTAVTNYDNKRNGKKPFAQKQPLIAKVAPIRLNDSIKKARSWKPSVIDARSNSMARAALAEWPGP